jgi:hypothetical protein
VIAFFNGHNKTKLDQALKRDPCAIPNLQLPEQRNFVTLIDLHNGSFKDFLPIFAPRENISFAIFQ